MFQDYQLSFSVDQEETAAEGHASTNVIDLGPLLQGRSPVQGTVLEAIALVTTQFTSDGSATLTCAFQCDTAAAFGSATELYSSGAIAVASLVAGYKLAHVRIPANCERYVRFYYTIGTAVMTAGAITAFIAIDGGGDTPNIAI